MTPEWNEWKGAMDVKMETTQERFNEMEERMRGLEQKVSDVVAKLSVPVFLSATAGPIIGALIVYFLTKSAK